MSYLFLKLGPLQAHTAHTLSLDSSLSSASLPEMAESSSKTLPTLGTSLSARWLRLSASNAGGLGLIPSQGTKIPHAPWCSRKKKKGISLFRAALEGHAGFEFTGHSASTLAGSVLHIRIPVLQPTRLTACPEDSPPSPFPPHVRFYAQMSPLGPSLHTQHPSSWPHSAWPWSPWFSPPGLP